MGAHVHVGQDGDLGSGEDGGGFFFAVVQGGASAVNVHLAILALEIEVYIFGVESGSGVTESAEETTEVRVVAEDGRLAQGGADHGAGQDPGVLFCCRSRYLTFEKGGGAFPVTGHLAGQVDCDMMEGLAESVVILTLRLDLVVACKSVGKEEKGVVGAGVTVH